MSHLCFIYFRDQIMNVDLKHIETKVAEILKHDRSLTMLHGELITR